MNSLVFVIHFQIHRSLHLFPEYQNVSISFMFSHTLILAVVFCRKMKVCKWDSTDLRFQCPNNFWKMVINTNVS
jgi:hypothetical protein